MHSNEALTPIPKSSNANVSHSCAVTTGASEKATAKASTIHWIPTNTIVNTISTSPQTETLNFNSNSFPSLALLFASHSTEITALSSTGTHALHLMLTNKPLPKDSPAPKPIEQSNMSSKIPPACPLSNNTMDGQASLATNPPISPLQESTTKHVTESQPHGDTPDRFLQPSN